MQTFRNRVREKTDDHRRSLLLVFATLPRRCLLRLERTFNPDDLSMQNMESPICMPIGFVHFLAQSETLQQVLDTVAEWINRIFNSDRASITLYENNDH